MRKLACLGLVAVGALAACRPSYSPNDYAVNAVQQANKVDQGVIVGYRQIIIRPDGTTGTVTGGAAGGIVGGAAGSQSTMATALGAVGGTLVGGLIGSGVEKATGNTEAFEYIIRKPDGSLMSVVQKDDKPLNIGQRVLLIGGNQARIVPDYTVTIAEPPPPPKAEAAKGLEHAPATLAAPAPAAAPVQAAPAASDGANASPSSPPTSPTTSPTSATASTPSGQGQTTGDPAQTGQAPASSTPSNQDQSTAP
ncbi:outer membrane lipoprotein [Arboricoccus pini]|nr:hypothetical protein [Arboricoccus pini]